MDAMGWPHFFGENILQNGLTFGQDEEIIVFLAALRTEGIYSEWFRYILALPEQEANNSLSWNPEEAGFGEFSRKHVWNLRIFIKLPLLVGNKIFQVPSGNTRRHFAIGKTHLNSWQITMKNAWFPLQHVSLRGCNTAIEVAWQVFPWFFAQQTLEHGHPMRSQPFVALRHTLRVVNFGDNCCACAMQ